MKKWYILFMSVAALLIVGCTEDETTPSETYKGYFCDTEGGMRYDFYQEPDPLVLVLNASKVPCDFTETIEEVPCGDTPIYLWKTYVLTISDTRATLTIGTESHKYDYVADKRTRKWSYHSGEYGINPTGYEEYKKVANIHKAIISEDPVTLGSQIRFFRKNGDKDELAFVSDGVFTYVEYGPKRMQKVDFPAAVEEHDMMVSKKDEYNWVLTGKEVEYRFHIQERELIQTKPIYKNIGVLSFTK